MKLRSRIRSRNRNTGISLMNSNQDSALPRPPLGRLLTVTIVPPDLLLLSVKQSLNRPQQRRSDGLQTANSSRWRRNGESHRQLVRLNLCKTDRWLFTNCNRSRTCHLTRLQTVANRRKSRRSRIFRQQKYVPLFSGRWDRQASQR